MSRPRDRTAPRLQGLKVPPSEVPPRRSRKILISLSEDELAALVAVAASRGGEPLATTARVLAVAAATMLLGRTAATRRPAKRRKARR